MKVLDALTVPNAAAWARWLTSNATLSPGVSLTLAKKGTTEPTSLSLDQAVEEALCHGWINGQGHTLDDKTHMQRFTPRAARSAWSKRNVNIVERLEKEGRMQDAGRRAVEAAKEDGRWHRAYSGSANLDEMQDLLLAVEADATAQQAWGGLGKQDKSMMYFQLAALKTEAGCAKRIRTFVERLSSGQSPLTAGSVNANAKRDSQPKSTVSAKDAECSTKKPNKQLDEINLSGITRTRSGRISRSTCRARPGTG